MRQTLRQNRDILAFLVLSAVILGGVYFWNLSRPATLIVDWTTESELDIQGFNLLRADAVAGDYTQINSETLPPADDPFVGAQHAYSDKEVRRGQTYYYILETVDRFGNAERSEPIELTAR